MQLGNEVDWENNILCHPSGLVNIDLQTKYILL